MDDMADLVKCVRKSGQNIECVPQHYQEWDYNDWITFLGQWFEYLSALSARTSVSYDTHRYFQVYSH